MRHYQLLTLFGLCSTIACAEVNLSKINGSSDYTIKIEKTVRKGDLEKFEDLLKFVKENHLELHMNAVQLNVAGGDPAVARDIGRLIREKRLNTFLSPKVDCVSACIYLAMGGMHRMIYGNILLHRPTLYKEELSDESVANSIAAHTQESNQFIADMGGSTLLAEAINFTPNWALRRLNEKEIKHWGIFGSDHIHDELAFRRGAKEAGVSNDKFKSAYVDYFDACRKLEYSFQSSIIDCTVSKLKKLKSKSQ